MTTIGEAFVLIRPDLKKFSNELGTGVNKAVTSSKGFKDIAKSLQPIGLALTGVGLTALKLSTDLERSQRTLKKVIENSGRSYDDYRAAIKSAVNSQEEFGHSAKDTTTALTKLTIKPGDPKKALDNLQLTADIATLKHISLADAADLVGKAVSGNARVLKQFGISTKDPIKAVEQLKQKVKGLAEDESKTIPGTLAKIRANITDFIAEHGKIPGAILAVTGSVLSSLSTIATVMDSATVKIVANKVATIAAAAATKAWAAAQWLLNIAMSANPIVLMGIALAALVAGIIIAYKKSETFRNAMQALGRVLLSTGKTILPAVRVAFQLLGIPIAALIVSLKWLSSHWSGIWSGLSKSKLFRSVASAVEIAVAPVRELVALLKWLQMNATGSIPSGAQPKSQLKRLKQFRNSVGKDIQQAQSGGFVRGEFGRPVPLIAHGGELVLNPQQQAALFGGSTTNNYTMNINSQGQANPALLLQALKTSRFLYG